MLDAPKLRTAIALWADDLGLDLSNLDGDMLIDRIRSALVATPPAERAVEALHKAEQLIVKLYRGCFPQANYDHELTINGHVTGNRFADNDETVVEIRAALATKPAVKDDETVVEAISGKQVDAALEKLEEIRNLKLTRSVMLQVLQAALAAKDGRS